MIDRALKSEPSAKWGQISALLKDHDNDLYLREAWADWLSSDWERTVEDPCQINLMFFKPDGVVSGRVRPALTYLENCGFHVLSARKVCFNRNQIRTLWANDWLEYSVNRLAFCDYLYTSAPALCLLLLDPTSNAKPFELSRLATLKGSAFPEKRQPYHLRSVLNARERVLNFVHTSDCFIDTIRETGILFSAAERPYALNSMDRDAILAVVRETEALTISHELDFDVSLARLALPSTLRDLIHSGATIPFADLRNLPINWLDPVAVWDLITVASKVIDLDYIKDPL